MTREAGPWVAGRPSKTDVYHTDAGCADLARGTNPTTVSEAAIEWHGMAECQRCAGERGPNTSGSMHPLATAGGES